MDIVFEDILCQITRPTPVGSVYDILPATETRCGRRTKHILHKINDPQTNSVPLQSHLLIFNEI